jgi:hypothetical protein
MCSLIIQCFSAAPVNLFVRRLARLEDKGARLWD